MIAEAIREILKLGKNEIVKVEDRIFSTQKLYPITEKFAPEIPIKTLTGLIDYIYQLEFDIPSAFIHVEDYNSVKLISNDEGPHGERRIYCHVTWGGVNFHFEHEYRPEDFIVKLQSCFVQNEDCQALTKFAGNLCSTIEKTYNDTGANQAAIVQQSVSNKSECFVKNPYVLQPFWTFPEIEQPRVTMTYRLTGSGDDIRHFLVESDGGLWKSQTIQAIKNYLRGQTELKIIA